MHLIFEWIDVTARAGDKVICESYVAFLYWLIEVQFEHNRQRFPNPTYFMKTPYTAYPLCPTANVIQQPPSQSLLISAPTALPVILLFWLNG